MKEKFEKLSKYLANFVAGTSNLDKLIRKHNFYERAGLGFNKNPIKKFQKPYRNKKAKIRTLDLRMLQKRNVLFRKVTNT